MIQYLLLKLFLCKCWPQNCAFLGSCRSTKPQKQNSSNSLGCQAWKWKHNTCFCVVFTQLNQRPLLSSEWRHQTCFLCGRHPNMRPRGLSGGLRDFRKWKHQTCFFFSQNGTKRPYMRAVRLSSGEVTASDVFLCGLLSNWCLWGLEAEVKAF